MESQVTDSRDAGRHVVVDEVRAALDRDFSHLISMEDVTASSEASRRQMFLSRALAALAIRRLTGVSNVAAAAAVVDGHEDRGLDAMGIIAEDRRLCLVQAKWSNDGTAGVGEIAVLRMRDALQKLVKGRYARFNSRVRDLAPAVGSLFEEPRFDVTMVFAVMGDGHLHPNVLAEIAETREDLAGPGMSLRHRVLHAPILHSEAGMPTLEPPVSLAVRMDNWMRETTGPYNALCGVVGIGDVADWYGNYRTRLIHQTLRTLLPIPRIQQKTAEMLETRKFWHLSPGITLLCDSIEPQCPGTDSGEGATGSFDLDGVKIINGAQTVASIHSYKQSQSPLPETSLLVRMIAE
ncbi:AIPR family protein [Streptomyces gamaensis]|uniref:AIPR family protein n=1 Tax=Streptomyces gamaensis TaxID=1763542 RepID=A0ABW0YVM8_9ACTN